MKFKVWDKVRVTREAIEESVRKNWCVNYWAVVGGEVIRTDETQSYIDTNKGGYPLLNQDLELVPEEPEFKRWEVVEVWHNAEGRRIKRIFICEAVWAKYPYICVDGSSEGKYLNWKPFLWAERNKIRKFKHKLTRKEIAEKFWVKEDFELVED